jgi:hypothetical protein
VRRSPLQPLFYFFADHALSRDLNSVYRQILVVVGATAAVTIAIAFAAAGCADEAKVHTTDSGVIGFSGCASIDVDACAANTTCTTIDGHTLYADGEDSTCVNWAEAPLALGCMNAGTNCDSAITFAAPADADDDITTCTLFTTTCIPAGWEVCTAPGLRSEECELHSVALPDWVDLDISACDDEVLSGVVPAETAVYFVGDYAIEGNAWSGHEWYVINPTPDGVALGFTSGCEIVWDMTGALRDTTGECDTCDIGVTVSATINADATTCSDAIIEAMGGADGWSNDYAIDDLEDGTATWHFMSNASVFGAGSYSDSATGFIAGPQCGVVEWL